MRPSLTPVQVAALRRGQPLGALAIPDLRLATPTITPTSPTSPTSTTAADRLGMRTATLPSSGAAVESVRAPIFNLRSPAEERMLVGLLAPLRKLSTRININEAWTWDASWRGSKARPRISYYESSSGRGETIAKRFVGSETATVELYDARDRRICGGGGCNPPFQTWFGWTPDPANIYCNPDTLISVMLQKPRYDLARTKLREHMAYMPALPRAGAMDAAQTKRLLGNSFQEAVREDHQQNAKAANVDIAENATAWAEWTMHAEALCKMALWSTNVRPEMLYDWQDPTGGPVIARPAVDRSPTNAQRSLQRGWMQGRAAMSSCYLWHLPADARALSRWSTYRYPLLSTLWRQGQYDVGTNDLTSRSDLPIRDVEISRMRVPTDERHFLIDNTIPRLQTFDFGIGGGRTAQRLCAFSGDAWGATPGENFDFARVPGVTERTIPGTEEQLPAYVQATRVSYEKFFREGTREEFQGSPYAITAQPVVFQGEQVVFAPGWHRSDRLGVWIPSPALLVAQTLAKCNDILANSFEQVVLHGMVAWADVVETLLPGGGLPQDFRRMAMAAFQSDLDMAESITGAVGGIAVQVIAAVNIWAGLVAAAVMIIATYLIDFAMESKMARGSNPLSIPMPMCRYIATDPLVTSECDFNPSKNGYDILVPQVGVIAAAAQAGVLDAVTLFGSLGESAGISEVEQQVLPPKPKLPYCG